MAAAVAAAYLTGTPGWLVDHEALSRSFGGSSSSLQASPAARTGLIFFTSPNRDTCREYLFDNSSGRQRDNGVVDCRDAIAQGQHNQAADRMNAITDAFRAR
jgi:hypothetical protein